MSGVIGRVQGSLIPVAGLAAALRADGKETVTNQSVKRRFKKIDARHPGFLVRCGDPVYGQLYVDMTRLRQLAPYYVPAEPEDKVYEVVADLKKDFREMRTDIAALRDNVGACIPALSI